MKRHSLLTVLCVLTFINTIFAIISNAMPGFAFDWFIGYMQTSAETIEMYNEQLQIGIDNIIKNGQGYYLAMLLISVATFISAVFMMKIKKYGLIIYTAVQVILLITPTCFGAEKFPNFWSIIFAALFVGLYHYAFKLTKELNETATANTENEE